MENQQIFSGARPQFAGSHQPPIPAQAASAYASAAARVPGCHDDRSSSGTSVATTVWKREATLASSFVSLASVDAGSPSLHQILPFFALLQKT